MRTRGLVLGSLLVILPTVAATPPVDWAVLDFRVPEGAAFVAASLDVDAEFGGKASAIGYSFASNLWTPWIGVESVENESAITTSRELGGARVAFSHQGLSEFHGGLLFFAGGAPADTRITMLLFLAGADMSTAAAAVVSDDGPVPFELRTGGGSTVVLAATPEAGGRGAQVFGTTVAEVTEATFPTNGIVGAFSVGCDVCSGTSTGPDSSGGSFVDVAGEVVGQRNIVGPAGPWRFEWAGSRAGPVVAAYAPVGDLWTAFAGPG